MVIVAATFVENVLLLLITSVLSGLAVPYILKRVDYRKTEEQRRREASLTRQAEIIDAQSKFLDDLSRQLWTWRYMSIKLSYYGAYGSDERQATSWQKYDEGIWDTLNAVRYEVSRGRRLVSEKAFVRLLRLYEDTMVELDRKLSAAQALESDEERRTEMAALNDHIYRPVTHEIDSVIDELATEMNLMAPSRGGEDELRSTFGERLLRSMRALGGGPQPDLS